MIDRARGAINAADCADRSQVLAPCEIAVPGLVLVVAARKQLRDAVISQLRAPEEWIVDFPEQPDCGVFIADEEVIDPFETEFSIIEKRLTALQPVVAVGPFAGLGLRAQLVTKAREANLPSTLIAVKTERSSDLSATERQVATELARTVGGTKAHGFQDVFIVEQPSLLANQEFKFVEHAVNQPNLHGPFDVVGDVHGCIHELDQLLEKLGYLYDSQESQHALRHTEHRKLIFAGDLVDRGPDSPAVVRLVRKLVDGGQALCGPGNHDDKLVRYFRGNLKTVSKGLKSTIAQYDALPTQTLADDIAFLDGLPHHLVLDDGKLIVAHAGLTQNLHKRHSPRVRNFALYGQRGPDTNQDGFPSRVDWAQNYSGKAWVVHGHTPLAVPRILNRVVCIDTGCVFGGALTAYRYPEQEFVSVQANEKYFVGGNRHNTMG